MFAHRHHVLVRVAHLIGAFAVLVALLPSARATPLAAQSDDDVLDLAAMALTPADIADADLEGIGLSNGILTNDGEAAAEYLWQLREDEDGAGAEALEEADPERAYIVDLIRPIRAGDPSTGTEQRVISYLFTFEDEDAAEEGFAVLAEGWESGSMEEESVDAEIGDEQLLVVGAGRDALNNAGFERLDYLFRIESIVAGVSVETFVGTPVDQEQVEALAERQAERIEDGLAGDGPGLSNLMARFDVPGTNALWDSYAVRDGEASWESTETEDAFEERQDRVEDEEVVDQYSIEQLVLGDTLPEFAAPLIFYNSRLSRLGDEDAAEDYMAAAIDRLASSSAEDLEELGELPIDADEALGFTYRYTNAGVDFETYRIYLRVGEYVLTLAVNTSEGLETEPIDELAELQIACVSGEESCVDPVRVPAELR